MMSIDALTDARENGAPESRLNDQQQSANTVDRSGQMHIPQQNLRAQISIESQRDVELKPTSHQLASGLNSPEVLSVGQQNIASSAEPSINRDQIDRFNDGLNLPENVESVGSTALVIQTQESPVLDNNSQARVATSAEFIQNHNDKKVQSVKGLGQEFSGKGGDFRPQVEKTFFSNGHVSQAYGGLHAQSNLEEHRLNLMNGAGLSKHGTEMAILNQKTAQSHLDQFKPRTDLSVQLEREWRKTHLYPAGLRLTTEAAAQDGNGLFPQIGNFKSAQQQSNNNGYAMQRNSGHLIPASTEAKTNQNFVAFQSSVMDVLHNQMPIKKPISSPRQSKNQAFGDRSSIGNTQHDNIRSTDSKSLFMKGWHQQKSQGTNLLGAEIIGSHPASLPAGSRKDVKQDIVLQQQLMLTSPQPTMDVNQIRAKLHSSNSERWLKANGGYQTTAKHHQRGKISIVKNPADSTYDDNQTQPSQLALVEKSNSDGKSHTRADQMQAESIFQRNIDGKKHNSALAVDVEGSIQEDAFNKSQVIHHQGINIGSVTTPQLYSQQRQRAAPARAEPNINTSNQSSVNNGLTGQQVQFRNTHGSILAPNAIQNSQAQLFFKKRASSNQPSSNLSQPSSSIQKRQTNNASQERATLSDNAKPEADKTSVQSPKEKSQPNSEQQKGQAQQTPPPKIPVICGFHKRILLITCQNQQSTAPFNPNQAFSQARRIRNKNPNCNHNSNSVFYQPHYNNVKYDDNHKKKEEVLRKVFFKECAREEERRIFQMSGNNHQLMLNGVNGNFNAAEMARQQALSQANDPNKHLKIIERILVDYLFAQLPFDRSKQQLTNTQSLMIELGLDQALTPHRGFLLSLIRDGKFTAENMLKVLSEVKTSATQFDNECIYCKYSQYALKESQKLLQRHQAAMAEAAQRDPQQALLQQQQLAITGGVIKGPGGEDIRIENLVRMFQTQLFKKSFINTSLMIIQRKMTEKYFQKYQSAKNAQQKSEAGPDGKPRVVQRPKPKKPNLNSLENLQKELMKLSKNLANPRDKERYLELKEKYYREFLTKVLKSNGVEKINFPISTFTPYKYYIGRGNNSGIVRTALKSRFWWSMGDYDDWDDYNFIWTQWKSNRILSHLKTWNQVQEAENKKDMHQNKRSSQSMRGAIDSQLSGSSTQATDKDSNSSKENLITTPKKNKLASANLLSKNNEDKSIKGSAAKKIRGKKEDKEPEAEVNHTSHKLLTYAKMENNYHMANKKALFYNMKVYYEAIGKDYFNYLPLTFHIKEGLNDAQFFKFEQLYNDCQDSSKQTVLSGTKFGRHLWIVKPGENTNRGCGIQVSRDLDHIKSLVSDTKMNGCHRSYIIQKYIEKPLLYKGRKFDIRVFAMLSTIAGNLQGFWYQDGYLRTSCREFSLKNCANRYVHLTNDAVQKRLDDYGKFESGNKLSYAEFQKYLDSINLKCDIQKQVIPKIKQLVQDSFRALSRKVDPHRKQNSFEIFGYDFMVDEDLNVWLIEVNTNPCFELSSPYLARLIPAMVENALKIAVDPVFPPPPIPPQKRHQCPDAMDNKFELVFNERDDSQELKNLPIDDNMNGIIEEEEMEEEGSDIDSNN